MLSSFLRACTGYKTVENIKIKLLIENKKHKNILIKILDDFIIFVGDIYSKKK